MDAFLAICQGAGLALSFGIGGAIVPLFAAAMAAAGAGIDLDGTDWEFLSSGWFIAVLLAVNVAAFYAARRGRLSVARPGREALPEIVLAAAAGALFFAGSLAEQGGSAIAGLLAGAVIGALAAQLAGAVRRGVSARTRGGNESTAEAVGVILAAAGIATAALALFAPPSAIAVAVALGVVARGRRRRDGEKYEGLRVLR